MRWPHITILMVAPFFFTGCASISQPCAMMPLTASLWDNVHGKECPVEVLAAYQFNDNYAVKYRAEVFNRYRDQPDQGVRSYHYEHDCHDRVNWAEISGTNTVPVIHDGIIPFRYKKNPVKIVDESIGYGTKSQNQNKRTTIPNDKIILHWARANEWVTFYIDALSPNGNHSSTLYHLAPLSIVPVENYCYFVGFPFAVVGDVLSPILWGIGFCCL